MDLSGILAEEWEPADWDASTLAEDNQAERGSPLEVGRSYISSLTHDSGLHLRKPGETQAAYDTHAEKGLFGLFVSEKLKKAWRTWTSKVLVAKGETAVTASEMDTYIGLEMAMSLIPITDMKELWSNKTFQGHPDFKATMGGNRFQSIRGSLKIHPPCDSDSDDNTEDISDSDSDTEEVSGSEESPTALDVGLPSARASATTTDAAPLYGETTTGAAFVESTERPSARASATTADAAPFQGEITTGSTVDARGRRDPLRHSRPLLEHFPRKFASFAVPFGVSSVDEIGVRTKARTRAKSFMPLKPDQFAIRLYAVVGWRSLYVHLMWDNGSGSTLHTSAAQRYTQLFPTLRQPLENTFAQPHVNTEPTAATALWVAMIAHQTQLHPAQSGRRLVVPDNFYTRNYLAKAILEMTDGETRMLGTVRQDWIGRLNSRAVKASIERVSKSQRGSWELVAAVDNVADSKKAKDAHARAQKRLPKNLRTEYAPPATFSENAGFVVFHDKQPVVFYTNDLATTPTARVLDGANAEAIACCHGLFPIQRWTGSETLHRKIFNVPAIVAAYNVAMNGVDRVDQLRSTNPTRRKEQRLSMSLLTWAMDLSIINAFPLMKEIDTGPTAPQTLREFKRRVCESLVQCAMTKRRDTLLKRGRTDTRMDSTDEERAPHVLTPNSCENSRGKLVCHLCSLQNIKSAKSRYGCTECRVGFHVECFAVAHFKGAFSNPTPSTAKALRTIQSAERGKAPSQTRRRLNNSITPLDGLSLPNNHNP